MGPMKSMAQHNPLAFAADHPNFTGSNPAFDAVIGPWDVDNDGDGIADSVWVDIGLPVQTAARRAAIQAAGGHFVPRHGRPVERQHPRQYRQVHNVTTNGPFAGSAREFFAALAQWGGVRSGGY